MKQLSGNFNINKELNLIKKTVTYKHIYVLVKTELGSTNYCIRVEIEFLVC